MPYGYKYLGITRSNGDMPQAYLGVAERFTSRFFPSPFSPPNIYQTPAAYLDLPSPTTLAEIDTMLQQELGNGFPPPPPPPLLRDRTPKREVPTILLGVLVGVVIGLLVRRGGFSRWVFGGGDLSFKRDWRDILFDVQIWIFV